MGTVTEHLPLDVIAQLSAMDTAIGPELVQGSWALLTPFHEKAGYQAKKIDRDLTYGDHPRHRLDVHTAGNESGAPVFVFVHGGGFIGGDKVVPGSPQYDHIGAWAVRNGFVGVTMTYRLAPEHTWPAGAQDVAAAVAWVRDNIAGYGGDPARIVVAGQSAGAVHVASYVTGQGGGSLDGVRGAAILSGSYELSADERGELERSYYRDAPAAAVSTLNGLVSAQLPLLFAVAERDPEFFQQQAARLVAAWYTAHRTTPNLVWVDGHNHISEIGSFGVDDAALGSQVARFAGRVTLDAAKGA